MTFSVRVVCEQDAASIVELLNPIVETGSYSILDGVFTTADQIDFIRSFPERSVYHVAVDHDGTVLGIQDVQPLAYGTSALEHVGDISTFVRLGSHRRGIGQSLSRETLPAARELGFTKILATIRADNPGAVSFYESLGFRVIGLARNHARVRGEYVDEILTEKLLD